MPDDEKTTKVPKGRLARTARFGSLVGGQSVKWTATNVANKVRSEDRATAANERRALDLADQLVKQLGQMKGAAMKIGQVLSTVDFDLIPEGEREEFKERLAALRDSAPKVAFKDMRKVAEKRHRRDARRATSPPSTSARSRPPRSGRSTARRRTTARTSR